MNDFRNEIRAYLDQDAKYRGCLYSRGFFFTDMATLSLAGYPFYGSWNVSHLGRYQLITHLDVKSFSVEINGVSIALVGHALNPYSGEIDEAKLLVSLAHGWGTDNFLTKLDELTGVFVIFVVHNDDVWAVQDAGGQKMLYFGKIGPNVVMASAPQLVGDIFGLKRDPEIVRLLDTKGYYRGSGFLPGNKSPYPELKRLGPNTCVRYEKGCLSLERIFPRIPLSTLKTEAEKKAQIAKMQQVFSSGIDLAMKKWPRIGLSLTGGVDSKTTFANAKKWYGQFFCFSFISKDSERWDAEAAAEICKKLGVEHHLYLIPAFSDEMDDYDLLQKILEQNMSNTGKLHSNEKRKYIFLRQKNDFDAEIKSDMSEVGRAYTSRKYIGVKLPRKLVPRHLTINQGRYFLEPWAMHYADHAYSDFMNESGLIDDIMGYTMHDLFYWEVRMGSWAATSYASQEYIHEIMIPYNNRNLLAAFLRFPQEDRLQDIPHKYLIAAGNPDMAQCDVNVKDSYFGKKRMLMETAYYYYATRLNTMGGK